MRVQQRGRVRHQHETGADAEPERDPQREHRRSQLHLPFLLLRGHGQVLIPLLTRQRVFRPVGRQHPVYEGRRHQQGPSHRRQRPPRATRVQQVSHHRREHERPRRPRARDQARADTLLERCPGRHLHREAEPDPGRRAEDDAVPEKERRGADVRDGLRRQQQAAPRAHRRTRADGRRCRRGVEPRPDLSHGDREAYGGEGEDAGE